MGLDSCSLRSNFSPNQPQFALPALLIGHGARSTPSSRLGITNSDSAGSRTDFWQTVYDTRQFNEEGYPLNKPTDCLFDYLTDHLLANHLFGDDIRLRGLFEDDGAVHVLITQPFIHGHHMDW